MNMRSVAVASTTAWWPGSQRLKTNEPGIGGISVQEETLNPFQKREVRLAFMAMAVLKVQGVFWRIQT